MSDNDDINITEVEIDSSLQVNKLLAKALNTEKLNHARTAATLHRYRQDLMQRDRENAVLRNSLKVILQNASQISFLLLNISSEINNLEPTNSNNLYYQSPQTNGVVSILKDLNVAVDKDSSVRSSFQQEIGNNESDTPFANDKSNEARSEEDDEEQPEIEAYERRRLDTVVEQTENDMLLNATQISSNSSRLIPKRLPLVENNLFLKSSSRSFLSPNNSDQSKQPQIENNPKILESSKKTVKSMSKINGMKISTITITRPSKKNEQKLNSFEDVSQTVVYNNSKLETSEMNSENQSLHETADDTTFNMFKNLPSLTLQQTSTPYGAMTSNNNGNFITKRKNKLNNEHDSTSPNPLKRCSVVLEKMDPFDMLTTQRNLIVDERDSIEGRPKRRTRTSKSLKEPSLTKKLRRQ